MDRRVVPLGDVQQAKADKTDFGTLVKKHPRRAAMVLRLDLTDLEKDAVAYTVLAFARYKMRCQHWRVVGNLLFFGITLAGALVPVLISLQRSYPEQEDQIQMSAIGLSIFATVGQVLESVYRFRQRATNVEKIADAMNTMFQEFCSLTGPKFDPVLFEETKGEPGTILIPDLSAIPLGILKAHVEQLQIDHQAAQTIELPREAAVTISHTGVMCKKYIHDSHKVLARARQLAFNTSALELNTASANKRRPDPDDDQ